MHRSPFKAKLIVILLIGLGVRLLGIASRPVWYDEAFSILFSEKGLSAMLYGTLAPTGAGSADIHPLGYYTVLWAWMRVFGQSLIATRLLSVLTGLVTVLLVYLIGLELPGDERTALLGALFAALAPFQIHYAQEIRMYSLLAMWLLLATYACLRGMRSGDWKWWALFSVSAALAQYTHHLAAFYLIPLALLPVFQKNWKAFYSLVLAGLGALLLYLPWAVYLPAQFSKVQSAYWVERPDISKVFTLLLVYVTNTPLPPALIALALAGVLILVTIAFLQTMRHARQTGAREGLWLFYLSFGPPLFLFVFSQWRPVYIERALLPSGAVFCLWLAWALTRTGLPKVVQISMLGLLSLFAALGIYQHVTYRDFPYGPYAALGQSLHQRVQPQDRIVHSNKFSMIPAMLFAPDLPQSFIGDVPGSSTDTLAPATQEVLQVEAEKDIQSATGSAGRIWYIIYQRAIDEYRGDSDATYPDLEYLDAHYTLQAEETWDGLRVFLYTKQP